MKNLITLLFTITALQFAFTQNYIPLDTLNWDITAKAYVLENYKSKASIYLQAGSMILKDHKFTNGTIEFDIFLKEEQCFPGIYFRSKEGDSEQWYIRPHLSGKPDANQVAPLTNGISPWQLYFGEKYSFPYTYKFDDWTHVKIIVNNNNAQVYLDNSETPNLSWKLYHPIQEGEIIFRGGNASGIHIANISINKNSYELKNFKVLEREPIEGVIKKWGVSDKFEEHQLDNVKQIDKLIKSRTWTTTIQVEEGVAANISRNIVLRDGTNANTVFTKIKIISDKAQTKVFEFGYSDRVVAILNGKPIYKGTNKWRSRDYRYLGTVGLFDAVYLNLKKGENTLLMAVSEDFGGWLITGRFKNKKGIEIKQ